MTYFTTVLALTLAMCTGLRFPDASSGRWVKTPIIQPFHAARATEESILVAWSIAHHSLEAVDRYELRVRWPLAVEPHDSNLISRTTPDGLYGEDKISNRSWAHVWSEFSLAYIGKGRQVNFTIPDRLVGVNGTVRVFDFQVRAITETDEWTDWSPSVLGHTLVPGVNERFNVELIGTGRNNPMHSQIIVAGTAVFNRTDLRGFALAVFDRKNFNLTKLDEYDVFESDSEADRMADDMLAQGPDKYVAVVSGYAWEWHFSVRLSKVFEFFGGYYVGQWSRVFENSIQPSEYADLQETASQETFAHPYCFFGSYGWGAGNGIESIQLNTGHYLAVGKAERAIAKIPIYYNYMLGRFIVGSEWEARSSDYFVKSQIPRAGTLHSPIKVENVVTPAFQVQPQSMYAPYIGNLHQTIEYLMEANETVVWDEFNATNYGFEIVQVLSRLPDPLVSSDPRAGTFLQTELERLWGGPSARDHPPSVEVGTTRVCPDILKNRESLNCSSYDSVSFPLLQFGIGLFPTTCHSGNAECASQAVVDEFSMIEASDEWVAGAVSARLGP